MNNRFNSEEKIILAIDGLDLSQAKLLLEKCPNIKWVKVGLELFVREGPRVIEILKSLLIKEVIFIPKHSIIGNSLLVKNYLKFVIQNLLRILTSSV